MKSRTGDTYFDRLCSTAVWVALSVGSAVFLIPGEVSAQGERFRKEVAFDNDVQPIVNNFCVTCHAGKEPSGDLLLTNYEEVREMIENGDLLDRINDKDDPMPPSGLMPAYMRRTLKNWADAGFVEKGTAMSDIEESGIDYGTFVAPEITPIELSDNEAAFQLLEKTQGHWVGSMWLMGQDWDWMAFDFRAIDTSHVHGIFEGGTVGNLFTSFFIAEFNGKRTIMARNGGILNGIYRTSYFVLDQVEERKNLMGEQEQFYRLVDAHGGEQIMYMELSFSGDSLQFNAFTSRMGLNSPPKPHMRFSGVRMHARLAGEAAERFDFPRNEVDRDFSDGLPTPTWVSENVPHTSASYVWTSADKSIEELGKLARDPYPIDRMPNLSKLTVEVERSEKIRNTSLLVYLSSQPLTDGRGKFITENGYLSEDAGNSILLFPEISADSSEFTFTYLHPGDYYLTVISDQNGDSLPTPGDFSSPSRKIAIDVSSSHTMTVADVEFRN